MREAMECTNARELLFDHRQGRLDDMDLVLLEGHLEECAACRDHQMRLVGMLDSTAALQPAREVAFDKDSLFERIAREVKTPPVEAAPRDVAPPFNAAKKAVQIHEEYQRRAPWPYIVAAIAACVLAIFLIPRLLVDPSLEPHGERMVELILESDEGTSTPEEAGLALAMVLANLGAQKLDSEIINIFASVGAEWRLEGDKDLTLHLERGALLVEFLPREDTTLKVMSPGLEARVIGTIFYVFAEEERLGVLSGEVEVASSKSVQKEASHRKVSPGKEVGPDLELSSIAPSTKASTDVYLDIRAHEAKLTALRDAAPPSSSAEPSRASDRAPLRPRKPSDQGSDKESEQGRRAKLLESGRRAMAARDYAEAANHYEALLREMPGTDPASMTIRLDLARLYRQHLDEPERAIGHLRTFVMNRPDDVAAPSAVQELCRLLSATDERDPLCIGR